MSDTVSQIEEMLKTYEPKEEVSEEVNETEETTDEITKEEPKEGEKGEDEITRLRREQKEMKEKLDEILSRGTPKEPEPEVIKPIVIEDQDFLSDIDFDSLTDNPKTFNDLLNKVFKKGIEVAKQELEANNLRLTKELPKTIEKSVSNVNVVKKQVDDFFTENSDLKPFRGAVATVLGEIAAVNPTWNYNKLLKATEEETRIRLGISKKSTKGNKVPSLPSKRSQLRIVPDHTDVDPLVAQIDEMNNSLFKRR